MSGRLGDKTFAELGINILQGSEIPILPPTRNRTITIPGRHGAYDMGADLEPRVFNLECAFVNATTPAELQQRVRALVAHLMDEYGNPRLLKLVFDIEPNKAYYVRYAGDLSIERIASFGRFTLPLVAYDPYAYGELEQAQFIITENDQSVTLENAGNTSTPVQLVIKNQGNTPINGFTLICYKIE